MVQPKDTETILKEFEEDIQPTIKASNLYINPVWLKQALASHLLWASQELRKDMPKLADKDHWALNMESIAQKITE